MRWIVITLLSGVLGVAAAASDVLAGPPDTAGYWRAAALVLNAGAVWAGLAVVCGWLARRVLAGAVAAVIVLAIAVVGYYGYAVLLGDRVKLGFSAVSGRLEFWLVAAVLLGPVLGVAGALARRRDVLGLLAAWLLPLGIATEMIILRGFGPHSLRVDPGQAAGELALLLVGLLLAVAALVRWLVLRAQPRAERTAAATRSVPEPISSV